MTVAERANRDRRTWRQRARAIAMYVAIFAVAGTVAFAAILLYRQLSIPLADQITTHPVFSSRPTAVPVWVDPVGLEVEALFGLRLVPLVAAVGLWAGSIGAVALAAGLAWWWWSDKSTSARLPPLSRLGYLVVYALVTTGPLYVLVPWLRDLGSAISEPELGLLIGLAIVATALWAGAILVVTALDSTLFGRSTSLWSMPPSRLQHVVIYAGAVVAALLVFALGFLSTPRFDQISWVGLAGALGIVAIVVVSGQLFVAPVTIVRDGRGPIEAIRWSNASIADSGAMGEAILSVFSLSVFVRGAAHLTTVPADPIVGLALATIAGTAVVGSIHALQMASVYRTITEDSNAAESITDSARPGTAPARDAR